LNIRLATARDAKELTRLRWLLITEDADASIDARFNEQCITWFEQILSNNKWFVVVADATTTELVGCMCLQAVEGPPDINGVANGLGYLTNCYVDKSRRDKKIGEAMLQKMLEIGKQLNLELIIVWPSQRSVRFYNRAGFQNVQFAHAEQGDEPPLEYCYSSG